MTGHSDIFLSWLENQDDELKENKTLFSNLCICKREYTFNNAKIYIAQCHIYNPRQILHANKEIQEIKQE